MGEEHPFRQRDDGVERITRPSRAIVVVPILSQKHDTVGDGSTRRADEARLEEAVGLARAIDLDIRWAGIAATPKPQPGTLLGKGKLDEVRETAEETGAELVIVDHALTPVQQRNLEREWSTKVLDRTGLILEIFGRRAATKEGTLQVELAHLDYQRGRLVRSWTHLERQRGGAGFMGGPGETQIEADRRILREKIVRLERQLETVRRTRQLQRSKRQKVPHPIVALVGYTNAGKSTLFNRLTGSGVVAKDMLFATLDPTLRRLPLPRGGTVILSDTVGFISNLPTQLVAAFRATLEEVREADLVLHVRDVSDPDHPAQAEDVAAVLDALDMPGEWRDRTVEVWNKIDALDEETAANVRALAGSDADVHLASARTGEGVDALLDVIERRIGGDTRRLVVELGADEGARLDWIYRNGRVIGRDDRDDGSIALEVELTAAAAERLGSVARPAPGGDRPYDPLEQG